MTQKEIALLAASLHRMSHPKTPRPEALALAIAEVAAYAGLRPDLLATKPPRGPYVPDEIFAERVYVHLSGLEYFPSTNMILREVSGSSKRIRAGIALLLASGRAIRVKADRMHQGIRLTPHPLIADDPPKAK